MASREFKRSSIRHHKKKGFELQVTFLVVMIISIVIFISGLYLMRQFFTATTTFQAQIDADTQREIERRLSESGEKVSLPINRKSFKVGEGQAFGLGILNTRTPDSQCSAGGALSPCNKFGVMVRFVKAVDSKTQQSVTDPANPSNTNFVESAKINSDWISVMPEIELTANQLKVVSIPVKVGNIMGSTNIPTRRSTIFIFNVCVFNVARGSTATDTLSGKEIWCEEGKTQLIPLLHGQKILKMYVEVP